MYFNRLREALKAVFLESALYTTIPVFVCSSEYENILWEVEIEIAFQIKRRRLNLIRFLEKVCASCTKSHPWKIQALYHELLVA